MLELMASEDGISEEQFRELSKELMRLGLVGGFDLRPELAILSNYAKLEGWNKLTVVDKGEAKLREAIPADWKLKKVD